MRNFRNLLLLLIGVLLTACDPAYAPKSTPEITFDPSAIKMRYVTYVETLPIGSRSELKVSLRNTAEKEVPAGTFLISYIWWNGVEATGTTDEVPLPDLPPNVDVIVSVPIKPPNREQRTMLKIDLLDQSGRWLSDEGAFKPLHYNVAITR